MADNRAALPFSALGALRRAGGLLISGAGKGPMVDRGLPRLGVLGAGRVGGSLARALWARGYVVSVVWSRTEGHAAELAAAVGAQVAVSPAAAAGLCDLALLAVPDDALASVVATIAGAGGWRPGRAVVHLSGSHAAALLRPAADLGALTGALHPLQTFADSAAPIPPGTAFAVEAPDPLRAMLWALAESLGGRPFDLAPEHRALYHAAAVLSSNYAVALVAQAVGLLERCGLAPEVGLQALLPLLRGAADSLGRLGLPHALTGPIARGDAGTVRRHLEALERQAPETAALYRALGLATLPLAEDRGLAPELVAQLRLRLGGLSTDGVPRAD